MDFTDFIKGALLHDIGKFIIRAGNNTKLTHQEIETELKKHGVTENISVFAAYHHHVAGEKPKHELLDVFNQSANELLMVYEADNLSSGERLENKREGKWQTDTPLMSVFSKISLDHRPGKPAYKGCWHYHQLNSSEEPLRFPVDLQVAQSSYRPEGYSDLLSSFEADFEKIMPELPTEALTVLLEKYTSYIPSEIQIVEGKPEKHPDVSLFDHLKTTAAIAACLYRYFEETCPNFKEMLLKDKILDRQDKRYMLVAGDFSGVQKFIYTISSKGALKTLRARSFFLELLGEHVIEKILDQMGLPRTNIIYAGGGRFYILAHNTPKCREALDHISMDINSFLYSSYHGQLYLSLEKVEFAGEAFMPDNRSGQDIAKLWGDVRDRLNRKKNRKFLEQITVDPNGFWSPLEPEDKTCGVCHCESTVLTALREGETGDEPVEVCPLCKQLYDLGDELPDAKFIARCKNKPDKVRFLEIEGEYYAVCSQVETLKSLDASITYVINSWSVGDYMIPGAVQMFTGNYTTRQGRGYKGFDTLAKEAAGADRIGILRMDVDNLGTIFTWGLQGSDRTFSRLSALSRSLTHFFKFYINEICKGIPGNFTPLRLLPESRDRNVTVVYAGGDDLFLVGAWDDVTELAFDVATCFRNYTGHNPDVTISGGVIVQDPKFPLYKLAELAGEAEERAKDSGRDSISLFYAPAPDFTRDGRPLYTGTLKWSYAMHLVDEIVKPAVRSLVKGTNGRVQFLFSKAFLHKLAAVSDIWRREGKLYLPRLAYTLAREGEQKDLKGNEAWKKWKQKIYDLQNITYLQSAVTWMDLLSKRGAEDERK